MVKDLLILRHGDAKAPGAMGDAARELKDKGKRNAQRVGVWLACHHLLPDAVLSSPATRAMTTAEKCAKAAGLATTVIQTQSDLYPGDPNVITRAITMLPETVGRLLVVGHNPGLESLVFDLSGQPVGLRPASIVHLSHDGAWAEAAAGGFRFVRQIDAQTLPALFPYPGPDDPPTRSRPAYYYTQSSVVPFRHGPDGLEVLIISSSKRKHWVVPKGIQEPGLSARASAAREALEEAGVEGEVLDQPIGEYQNEKWEAACTVTVYPMRVTHEYSEDQWEEHHRGRRWVSVNDAISLVDNPDLQAIIAKLPDLLASGGEP